MIRIKKGNCVIIGNRNEVCSELIVGIESICNRIVSESNNSMSFDEALDLIVNITIKTHKEVLQNGNKKV